MTAILVIVLIIAFAIFAIFILCNAGDGSDKSGRPFKYYDAEDFHNTYLAGLCGRDNKIGEDVHWRISDALFEGKSRVKVYDDELEEIIKRKEQNEEFDRKLFDAARLNNEGMAAEKSGDIENAISIYERNILPGTYFTLLPYHRLCVLYRRQKDFDNEIRVIEAALSRFDPKSESKERQLFAERLEKARKYNKQSNEKSES